MSSGEYRTFFTHVRKYNIIITQWCIFIHLLQVCLVKQACLHNYLFCQLGSRQRIVITYIVICGI